MSGSERDSFVSRRIPDNNTIIQFKEWLGNGQGMAMATVRGYASAVKTINEWAMVNGIFADSIFDLSATDARKVIAILVALIISRTEKTKGVSHTLLIELPEYKTPNLRTVFIYVWEKISDYLTKAGTTILYASLHSSMSYLGLLSSV